MYFLYMYVYDSIYEVHVLYVLCVSKLVRIGMYVGAGTMYVCVYVCMYINMHHKKSLTNAYLNGDLQHPRIRVGHFLVQVLDRQKHLRLWLDQVVQQTACEI